MPTCESDQDHKKGTLTTDPIVALQEYPRNVGMDMYADFLRDGKRQQIGAEWCERSNGRETHRNGYRERMWETRVGEVPLCIPKLRRGSYTPSFLEPQRRAKQALLAVNQTAHVISVSTRKVDDLVQALGLSGVDTRKVSRICKELDEGIAAFRDRELKGEHPYLWLDDLCLKARHNRYIVNMTW